jgi:hypothetical protein
MDEGTLGYSCRPSWPVCCANLGGFAQLHLPGLVMARWQRILMGE